jgi:hypothetical protein
MTLNPRQSYHEDQIAAKFHRDLVTQSRFRDACHAALLEQIIGLPLTYEVTEAAAAYNRIIGARDFITHLLNIAEEKKPAPVTPSANLNHRI